MDTMKTKADLADKFSGASSLLFQPGKLSISGNSIGALEPTLDVPVKVDTLEFEQGDPDIEHYKVIGLAGDWVQSAEPGDITLGFRVPTKSVDVLEMAYGEDAVKKNITATLKGFNYSGNGLILKNKKVVGTWIIVNDTEDQVVIINNATLYASLVLDQDAKGVIAIDFNGSIESDGSTPDVLFLTKGEAVSG